MHIGSQITEATPFEQAVRKVLPLVKRLQEKYALEFFSIGGGLGIVYQPALASGAAGVVENLRGEKHFDAAKIRRAAGAAAPTAGLENSD